MPTTYFGVETPEVLAGEPYILTSLSAPSTARFLYFGGSIPEPVTKLLCSSPDWSATELATMADIILCPSVTVTHSEGNWIELSAPGADKESALARICRRLGAQQEDVVVIGDQTNDIGMLKWGGVSVAVANAIPSVLELVDIVVPSNAEEGVAQFMEGLAQGVLRS